MTGFASNWTVRRWATCWSRSLAALSGLCARGGRGYWRAERYRTSLQMPRSRKRTAASSQLLCRRKSWTSSGKTNSSTSYLLLAQRIGQHHGLVELNVGIVVALDQRYRRTPALEISHGRSFERHAIVGLRGRYVELGGPIAHAVETDSGPEEIGSGSQGHGGEVAAVRAAPGADPHGVAVAAR